ncbi:hypothetical protein EJB05_26043, partial [Eragrostis curvula]
MELPAIWTFLAFAFLTWSSASTVYRSGGDSEIVRFVVITYCDLLALFLCLRFFERMERGDPRRSLVRATVWVLTSVLTVAFSMRLSVYLPPSLKIAIWLPSIATVAFGFVLLVVCNEQMDEL